MMSSMQVPPTAEVAWTVAFAVGLAYTAKPDSECVHELLHATRGEDALLGKAVPHTRTVPLSDPVVGRRATRLLEAARELLETVPTAHATAGRAR